MGSVYTAKLALARGRVGRAKFGHRELSPPVILEPKAYRAQLFQDSMRRWLVILKQVQDDEL